MLTMRTGHSHSTIWKVLHQHGLSRPARAPRGPARRYEWPCPGDLLHTDWDAVRPFRAARTRRHRRAPQGRPAEASEGRLRLRARARRRSLPLRLRRAPARLPRGDRDRLPRACAGQCFAARGNRRRRRLMTDNPLEPTARNRSLRELLAGTQHPPSENAEAAAAGQRQGRALPPDDGPRVGLRPPLPLLPTPRRRPATLAALLQRTQTPQLPRRTTAPQPRSQRLWAGQLV